MELLQQLHDSAIGGTVAWIFDGAWTTDLGWAGGFNSHSRGNTAQDIVDWLTATAARAENRTFVDPGDLYILQVLHDAEINGSVTWWKPREGFTVALARHEERHFRAWPAAETWLHSIIATAALRTSH